MWEGRAFGTPLPGDAQDTILCYIRGSKLEGKAEPFGTAGPGAGGGSAAAWAYPSPSYQPMSLDIVTIAAGSSGNITGSSFVRAVRLPTRLTIAFTGQPQAL